MREVDRPLPNPEMQVLLWLPRKGKEGTSPPVPIVAYNGNYLMSLPETPQIASTLTQTRHGGT
jgi:hypothetical protein